MRVRCESSFLCLLLWFLAFTLAACGTKDTGNPQEGSSPRPKKVIIATLMSHPALDQIITSLKQQMESLGYAEGNGVVYKIKNASGNQQVVATIAEETATAEVDAVVAITTPMTQAVAKVVKVPLVFSAVTDPVGAGLVPSLDKPGDGITGVSDAWPYREQLQLLREISPDARRIAVLFNPGDAASQYGMKMIRTHARELGFELVEGSVSTSAEVGTVAETLIDRADAIYLSSDATVISGFAAATKVSFRAKKPLIAGDSGTVERGALAAVSVGYKGVGLETGKLLHRVLSGERRIPVVVARGDQVYLNTKAAELTGLRFSDELIEKATKVFTEIP